MPLQIIILIRWVLFDPIYYDLLFNLTGVTLSDKKKKYLTPKYISLSYLKITLQSLLWEKSTLYGESLSPFVAQVGLELLGSCNPPALPPRVLGLQA